jgi:hypothetical protein
VLEVAVHDDHPAVAGKRHPGEHGAGQAADRVLPVHDAHPVRHVAGALGRDLRGVVGRVVDDQDLARVRVEHRREPSHQLRDVARLIEGRHDDRDAFCGHPVLLFHLPTSLSPLFHATASKVRHRIRDGA